MYRPAAGGERSERLAQPEKRRCNHCLHGAGCLDAERSSLNDHVLSDWPIIELAGCSGGGGSMTERASQLLSCVMQAVISSTF